MPVLLGSDARRPTHCPQCSARVRGDVPWCLACYARLDDADPSGEEAVGTNPADPGPVAPPPRTTASTVAGHGSPPDVDELAARMLAELAASGDRPTWAGRLPTTSAGRAVLVAGLLAVGCAVLLSAMALAGLAL